MHSTLRRAPEAAPQRVYLGVSENGSVKSQLGRAWRPSPNPLSNVVGWEAQFIVPDGVVRLRNEYVIVTSDATMTANPTTTIAQYGKGWQVVDGMDSNFEDGHTEDGQRLLPKSPTTRTTTPRTTPTKATLASRLMQYVILSRIIALLLRTLGTRVLNQGLPLVLSLDLDSRRLCGSPPLKPFVRLDEIVVDLDSLQDRRVHPLEATHHPLALSPSSHPLTLSFDSRVASRSEKVK